MTVHMPQPIKHIATDFQKSNYESLIYQLQLENQFLKEKIGYENELNMAMQNMIEDLQDDHQRLCVENQQLKAKIDQLGH